jgi:TatA/E family protein of Tat protein translocase
MIVSSRTPEGTPNQCGVCGKEVRIEHSMPFGDATCPTCGSLMRRQVRFAYERLSWLEWARAIVVALAWIMVTTVIVVAMAVLGFALRFSTLELVLLAVIGVILFGKRLPDVGRSLGKTITRFKKGMKGRAER